MRDTRTKIRTAALAAALMIAGAVPAATADASASGESGASNAPAASSATPAAPKLPSWTVLTDATGAGSGEIFLAPSSADGTYANGVEILSPDGS